MAAVHESHENYSEVRCSLAHALSLDCKKGFYLSFSQLNVSYFPRNSFLRGSKAFPDTSFKLSTFLSWNCNKSCFDLFHFQLITIHRISKWRPYKHFFCFYPSEPMLLLSQFDFKPERGNKGWFWYKQCKGRLYCWPYWANALKTYFWNVFFFVLLLLGFLFFVFCFDYSILGLSLIWFYSLGFAFLLLLLHPYEDVLCCFPFRPPTVTSTPRLWWPSI